jgi:hypothetical protein
MGPSYHGMARPLTVDDGTVCNTEGRCELIELAIADNWRGVDLHFWGLG